MGKAPEHLSEKQQLRVNLIASQNPRLYRAYLLKEQLRLLLKLTKVDEAEGELKRWLWKASHSRIPAFKELYQKIKRHKTHILNTIRYGMSNARIEATNNKIKLIIRKAYGFRNIQNMLDMVYLVCSDIRISFPAASFSFHIISFYTGKHKRLFRISNISVMSVILYSQAFALQFRI